MTLIFDVDGTLIGGEEQDWPSFDAALVSEIGFKTDRPFWESLEEVTAKAIIRRAAEQVDIAYTEDLASRIEALYLKNLRQSAPHKGTVFQPKAGVLEILNILKQTAVFGVAIATGDFRSTSRFKLGSAEIDIEGIPHLSSSDREKRADIITLAAERAGGVVEESIYFGDGIWDLKACEKLGIPFVGTGRNIDQLKAAGAEHVVEDLSPERVLPLVQQLL